ncbi:MmpS family membrane protein [Glaciihabitans tibetensis]|uniref:MmpS family membrane protein n=1 Tax=Glaciihabitans tibetensis TaxID=1266600 RepID=A0A2T0VE52_9MICO|nr:MmpS family transport accessory protein [Glaciihabitans tibetensis]PRY68441.1 MmpS family membrane protein [Glaciihabitans tibetensis]
MDDAQKSNSPRAIIINVNYAQHNDSPYSAPFQVEIVRRGNGLGVTAIVLGSVALFGSIIPIVNFASGFLGFLGLIFGITGWALRGRRKAPAVVGTVLSSVAIVLSILLAIAYTAGIASAISGSINDSIGEGSSVATNGTLMYEVTGDGTDSTIAFTVLDAGRIGSEQVEAAALPFTREIVVTSGSAIDFSNFSLVASSGATGTTISCRITLDGMVIAEQIATGPYASVSCHAY